jgi:hypothetical protein
MCGRLIRLTIVLFVAACASTRVSGPPMKVGDPLPGLTPAEVARFQAGKAVFQRTFDAAHGLGRCSTVQAALSVMSSRSAAALARGKSAGMTPKSMRASSPTISATN